MSLFGLLGLGHAGIQANTFGTHVSSHNASNVGTEGYTRRTAQLRPVPPPPRGGGGVRAAGAARVVDQFVERRLTDARSSLGSATARTRGLGVLDQILGESAGGLGASLDAFENSFVQLAAHPRETASRGGVLARADRLAVAFRTASSDLRAARQDANDRLTLEVGQVNEKLRQIGQLGKEIARSEVGGQEASDLRDLRDQLLREVADFVPIKVIEESDSRISVLLAGSLPLVTSDGAVHAFETDIDATTGDARVLRVTAGARVDVTSQIDTGSIGGIVEARDGALRQTANDLDQLAFDLIGNYNTAHAAGFGLDGVDARNLFEPAATATGAAALVQVSADVAGQPERIAAAQDATTLPGDNRNALALQQLADAQFAAAGTATAATALSSLIATGGTALSTARNDVEASEAAQDQLVQLREGLSGVSLDEEMLSLTRFQRAYEASIRVVQVADEMLGELMSLAR